MIDRQNFFDQPVKDLLIAYHNIWKIATGQEDDYMTGGLLDYNYFKKHYKMIAIVWSTQQSHDLDPKAIQQINFTGNLDRDGNANTTKFSIIEETKKTKRTVGVLWMYFTFTLL